MTLHYLSKHFTLAELTHTNKKIGNPVDSPAVIAKLRDLCENVLEPVREHFGRPVLIHSGYRCPALNKMVKGSVTSLHMRGEAADFHVKGHTVYEVTMWIRDNLVFDELILENFVPGIPTSGWVHCGFNKANRGKRLTKFKGSNKYHEGIILKP